MSDGPREFLDSLLVYPGLFVNACPTSYTSPHPAPLPLRERGDRNSSLSLSEGEGRGEGGAVFTNYPR